MTGTEAGGPLQRPHLTENSKLMGTGAFAGSPIESMAYKRGYLCGVIRGDGHLSTFEYTRGGGRSALHHRFRLALTDFEALARTQCYLDDLGVETGSYRFAAAHGRFREVHAIRTARRASVDAVRQFIAWPGRGEHADWYKGYLAGIYDAEGNFSGSGCVRICNTDATIIDWTTFACRRLGIPFVVESAGEAKWNVRVRGGLEQQLRFFHLTDPAITRKRSIEGRAVKSQSRLRVVGIEPLGMELPLYDITTGTGDYIADGVVSHNCFARPTHEYLDLDAGRDFEKEIVVKVNVPEVLRKELARPSWCGEHVAMGTNTDPYQRVEGRYKLMRGIWAALRDAANPCSVLTKSPLILRDLDLLKEVAERTEVTRVPVRADARRGPVARERAAHAAPACPARGGREAQRGGHPDRRADRAAPARDQRRARAGRADHRAGDRGGRDVDRRADAVPPRRGARDLLRLAPLVPARPRRALRAALRAARPARQRERRAIERAAGLRIAHRPGRSRPAPHRGSAAAGQRARTPPPAPAKEVRQESLF